MLAVVSSMAFEQRHHAQWLWRSQYIEYQNYSPQIHRTNFITLLQLPVLAYRGIPPPTINQITKTTSLMINTVASSAPLNAHATTLSTAIKPNKKAPILNSVPLT